jgi:hypothetical protein
VHATTACTDFGSVQSRLACSHATIQHFHSGEANESISNLNLEAYRAKQPNQANPFDLDCLQSKVRATYEVGTGGTTTGDLIYAVMLL